MRIECLTQIPNTMKRLVTIVVLMLGCITTGVAQDVIVTQESELIEADILEISETAVKYKKHSNPTGPTFVLSTAKISSIIYANGDVQAFNVKNEGQKKEYEPYNHLYRGIEVNLTAGANVYLSSLVNASAFMGTVGIGRRFNPNFYAGLSFSFIPETEAFPLMAVARGYIPLKNPKYEATTEVGFGYVINSNGMYLLSAIPGIQMPLTNWVDIRVGAGIMAAFADNGTLVLSCINASLAFHGTTSQESIDSKLQVSIEGGTSKILEGYSDFHPYDHVEGTFYYNDDEPRDFDGFEITPVVSYKVNPRLSLGVGIGISFDGEHRIDCDKEYTILNKYGRELGFDRRRVNGSIDYNIENRFFFRGEYRLTDMRLSPFASVDFGFRSGKAWYGYNEFSYFTLDLAPAIGLSFRVAKCSYLFLKCQYNLAIPKSLGRWEHSESWGSSREGRDYNGVDEVVYSDAKVSFSRLSIMFGFSQTL